MKIAIPVENGRLHDHFGGCTRFALVEANRETREILSTEIVAAPQHVPGAFPRWLREQEVQTVIAGGIGRRALANFSQHGIEVRAGTPNATVEELTVAYLNGRLEQTPDGCEHHGHHHHHHHQHHHHDE